MEAELGGHRSCMMHDVWEVQSTIIELARLAGEIRLLARLKRLAFAGLVRGI